MANQVGPAATGGSVTDPGSSAPLVGTGQDPAVEASGTGEDVVPFVSQVPGTPVSFPSFHGRSVSWAAVSVIMVAFLIGGLALCFGPLWPLFWVALGLAAVGMITMLAVGAMDDWY